jgi:adenylate cyclase
MGQEIERKFLVTGTGWRPVGPGRRLRQGYLCIEPERSVRVRIGGELAWLTVKGRGSGVTRLEFEYLIPVVEAERLLAELCIQPIIDKTRYEVHHGDHLWEVDEFHGANAGLVVAEIELQDETERFERPDWLGEEVSSDPRYLNANLVHAPFSGWPEQPEARGRQATEA